MRCNNVVVAKRVKTKILCIPVSERRGRTKTFNKVLGIMNLHFLENHEKDELGT